MASDDENLQESSIFLSGPDSDRSSIPDSEYSTGRKSEHSIGSESSLQNSVDQNEDMASNDDRPEGSTRIGNPVYAPQELYNHHRLVPEPTHEEVDELYSLVIQQSECVDETTENVQSPNLISFTGRGRTLSGEERVYPQQPETVVHQITFWNNGFTVNGGPLRRFEDPDNASSLEKMKEGCYPDEFNHGDNTSKVQVLLTRTHANCPVSALFFICDFVSRSLSL